MMRRVGAFTLTAALLAFVAGCAAVRWTSVDEWSRFVPQAVSNPDNPVTLGVGSYGGTGLGSITEFGTQPNDRRWWALDELVATDSELLTLWWGHSPWGEGGGQLGQVHRAQTLPDGTVTGYVVWHDYIYGQDAIIHGAVWRSGPEEGFSYVGLGSALVEDLRSTTTVLGSSRSAGQVTLLVPTGHVIQPGDTLMVDVADPAFDGVFRAGSVGADWVRYPQTGPAASGGGGIAHDLDRVMPYWVRSRLVGRTLAIKVWPNGDAEPAWTDPDRVRIWEDTTAAGPVAPGRTAVYAGHIEGGDWVEYGPLDVVSLDFGASEAGAAGSTIGSAPAVPAVGSDRVEPEELGPTSPTPGDRAAAATLTGETDLQPVSVGAAP